MAKLITGGAGFIGSELAHMLVDHGEEVVLFVRTIRKDRIGDIEDKVKMAQGDLGNWSHVLNAVKDYKITHIYHLGSVLPPESDANPWTAFRTNIIGTYNVLEAARLLNVDKVMFSSAIGAFGAGAGTELTDVTLQRPHEFYGVGKLFCEGLGRFYRKQFGLDFRSVRYPAVIGPGITAPGRWYALMIEHAVMGKPYECPVYETLTYPVMYYKDAARAADMVLQAPKENIQMVNYNVAGVTSIVSAKELEQGIKRHIPDAVITYTSKPRAPHFLSYVRVWDDTYARKEWGWKPAYLTIDQIVYDFIKEMKSHPECYAIN